MDKPTARIIAVADKGGVAGARGAGHHLTEEATKEQGVRQPCSYRSVCDISVLIFHIMYQSGEEIQPNCSNSFRTLSGISDKSPFPNLKRTYTLASAGQLVAVVPLKNTRSLSPSCSPSKWLLGDTTKGVLSTTTRGSPFAAESYTPVCGEI